MANERSPNYPSIGLDQAVHLARQVFEKERRAVVPTDVIASALGYNSKTGNLSGSALSKIGALRQYGLIEKAPQGKSKISERAIDLILGQPDSSQFLSAAKDAALAPSLFRELFHDQADASDDALRVHLIRDRGYISQEAANRVIRSFRESISFAKLNANDNPSADSDGEVGDDRATDDGPALPGRRVEKRPVHTSTSGVSYSWPLGDGTSVELAFSTDPTQANIDILLAQLQIVRSIATVKKSDED